jgi:Icc-related predicted phosphoesterase
MPEAPITRIAAVGDLHCSKASGGKLQGLFAEVGQHADVLLLCGDLTQKGHPDEVRVLVRELKAATVPILAVLGNHDFESNEVEAVTKTLDEAGVAVLDGETWERGDVGFAGVKGFGGGFGEWSLAPWGEPAMKLFVEEATKESLKLERALASLRTRRKVALLHYAPIAATVMGEPLEIQPFLGSGRLEEPLDRYHVDAAFHGHAHKGSLEGRTRAGIPVFNVALPLLRDRDPDLCFHVLDLGELDAATDGPRAPSANPVSRPL